MAQYDFGTIDPNTKSGTALASDLNSWRNAVHSTHAPDREHGRLHGPLDRRSVQHRLAGDRGQQQ